ncbi:MAG: restriction endonuclease [Candidatus Moranbacteria bacterium]|nr:restriction endonuclease [Candidatus Moranbacteria bacterium]
MSAQKTVIKTTGDVQSFSTDKLRKSLRLSGASKKIADKIVKTIESEYIFKTTKDIHKHAFDLLKEKYRPVAARYNLKRAIIQLGPTGYPFEQFVARLLNAKGYWTKTGKIMKGMCVSHEVDVLAKKGDRHFIFECKFHNKLGIKSDVQVALYMKARYDDILARWERLEKDRLKKHLHRAWIVTNTEFTSQARDYAKCAGIRLMSWEYPKNEGLVNLIDETGLHPITAVTSLTKKQKDYLVTHGLLLCNEVEEKKSVLNKAGIYGSKLERVMREAEAIHSLKEKV